MAWFAEKGFRLLVVQELTKTQPDYSADLLSSDGERRGGYKSGTGAVKVRAKLRSAHEGVTKTSSEGASGNRLVIPLRGNRLSSASSQNV
jgi:hypothetical protein